MTERARVAGINFQWGEEGVFGMALSPVADDGYRVLFFHPLSGHREFAVSTRHLRRPNVDSEELYHEFRVLESRGPGGHVSAHYMHDDGVLYFNLIDRNAVGCWNSRLPYTPANMAVVDADDEALIFPSDVKTDALGNLWVISDRMPVHLLSKLDFVRDVNFRVFYASAGTAVAGTVCDPAAVPYRRR